MKRALVLLLIAAAPAFAQEYGRASAGSIDLTTKSANRFDGSFSFSSSRSLGATFGGTVVKDRVWFFASADRQQPMLRTTSMPTTTTDLSAVLAKTRPAVSPLTLPKDSLSLHSTTVLSPSAFMTFSVQTNR